ncbi:hypothetical protein Vafri_19813 [Volvox africanus]|uniref:Uncharacterized protein n=1 Tax=Volvox africanus TaxID=51714 RepID=A0A8J4BQ31_9CHLO|nr:hypothetical protein Vafri_19813 [Volvox africanus]
MYRLPSEGYAIYTLHHMTLSPMYMVAGLRGLCLATTHSWLFMMYLCGVMKMVHGMDRYIQLLLSVTQDRKRMDLLYIRWLTAPEEDWNRKRSLPIPGQCKTSCTHGC